MWALISTLQHISSVSNLPKASCRFWPPQQTPWFSRMTLSNPSAYFCAILRPRSSLPGTPYGANATVPFDRHAWWNSRVSGTLCAMLNATSAIGCAWTIALRSGRIA